MGKFPGSWHPVTTKAIILCPSFSPIQWVENCLLLAWVLGYKGQLVRANMKF